MVSLRRRLGAVSLSARGRFVAPGAACAGRSRSQPLAVRLMLQFTQCAVQQGGQRGPGAIFCAGSQELAACKTLGIDADFVCDLTTALIVAGTAALVSRRALIPRRL